MKFKQVAWLSLALFAAACGEQSEVLVGERLTVEGLNVSETAQLEDIPKLQLAKPRTNSSWTHQSGTARGTLGHLSLATSPNLLWSASVGQKQDRRHRMIATPVASEGRVYTLDSRSQVAAVSTAGAVLWTRDLTAIFDRTEDAAGGGLAIGGDQLFVTTGFGEIIALNLATGVVNWRHDLSSFGGAAPTVFDGLVYVASRDGSAWAIHAESGKIKWQVAGPGSASNLIGGPGPAITEKWAIFPFATGELMSTFRRGGLTNWTSVLSGQRTGSAAAAIDDITGGPIVEGARIFVGNAAGRTAALGLENGNRIWTAEHGVQDAIAVAGNALFVVDDENQLVRLSAVTGATQWSVPLPRYKTSRVKRRKGIYAHFGPTLAGGQLWIASSDDQLRAFSPETGALTRSIALRDAATSRPIVVNNTLYVLTADARLNAFR